LTRSARALARSSPHANERFVDLRDLRHSSHPHVGSEFRPEEFKDDYRDRLMKFIETKARGRKPRLKAVRSKPAATTDLMDKLTKSLKAAQKEKKVA